MKPGPQRSILLVRASDLTPWFRASGFRVFEADDATVAEAHLQLHPIDVLVSTHLVRREDGIGLLRWVREAYPGVFRVLLAEAHDAHIAVDALVDNLIDKFLLRSWSPASMRRAVTLALDLRAQGDHVLQKPKHTPTWKARSSHDDGHILVVDDDLAICRAIARNLERHDFTVRCVHDGREAIHSAVADPPRLAIVDLGLPAVGGFEVIRELKSMYGDSVPLLALTGITDPQARRKAFAAGAHDFVCKPLDTDDLLRRVQIFERMRRVVLDLKQASERAETLYLYAREASNLLVHDLNNALSIASMNLSFLRTHDLLDTDAIQASTAAQVALDSVLRLARNFTDIDGLEDGVLRAHTRQTEIRPLLVAALRVHETQVIARAVTIELVCPEALSAVIDPVLLERITHNVVGNAMRYVDDGGAVFVDASVHLQDDRADLIVKFCNTGPPIPDELVPGLFGKYNMNTAGGQRGIGLYFCRLACEAHGGAIQLVASEPTTFIATFPNCVIGS